MKLGATDDRACWAFRDWSEKLRPKFGRMKGMYRLHSMSSEILQALVIDNDPAYAAALLVQYQKSVFQMTLDLGD